MTQNLLDAIRADYKSHEMVPVEIPEWGGTFYVNPLTMRESRAIRTGHGDDEEAMVISAVLEKLLDKDGKRVFPEETRAEARATLEQNGRQSIVLRIAQAMGLTGAETVQTAKNG